MTADDTLQTWDLLKEFGFQPDFSVISDVAPGMSFDFGNFKLSASAVTNMRYLQVVMFTGVMTTPRTLSHVQFEIPRQIASREKCAAWLVWNLDQHADRVFQPRNPVEWLDMGRTNKTLLPWVVDLDRYKARPHCCLEREWARLLLKQLKATLPLVPEDILVWFSFDGEVLKIRCDKEIFAAAAVGKPWQERYGLKAGQLNFLPKRLMHPLVEFSAWEGNFIIGNYRYENAVSAHLHAPTENQEAGS